MPHDNRNLGRAVRDLMEHRPGKKYTEVRAELLAWIDGREETYAEAVAILSNPANEVMCQRCGWTCGMCCPECGGCGCNVTCTGWRHKEYTTEDDAEESPFECRECGGDSIYTCNCV